jgi:ribose 5-phosphate isomerase RpiB
MEIASGERTLVLRIAIVCDSYSFAAKDALLIYLSGKSYQFIDLGVYSSSEEYDYVELAARVASAFKSNQCNGCIGLSLTGNGLQIYANKYTFIRAAPCVFRDAGLEAVAVRANMCDIKSSLSLQDIFFIVDNFLAGIGHDSTSIN